jgi:hypothetical protein
MRLSYLFTRDIQSGTELGRRRKSFVLIAIGFAHALAILWLATRPGVGPEPKSSQGTMTLVDVAGGASSPPSDIEAKPAPPVPPIAFKVQDIVEEAGPLTAAVPGLGPGAGAEGKPGGCGISTVIGQAIQQDSSAMGELAAVPRGLRTTADAVMLWDGQWLQLQSNSTGALRKVVAEILVGTALECRNAPLLGPQLIPISEPERTTMIVFGSGSWRWSDLIKPDECRPEQATQCEKPETSLQEIRRPATN